MATLRVLTPNHPGASYVLTGERITVGRRPDNMIQIMDPSISAHHAELLLSGDHYRLHDLRSTNLCFVDGEPVTDFHLHLSCKIKFGTVECQFDATPVEPAVPGLTPAEMEKDITFLRRENLDLQQKIDALQRQIDILSSARLVTGKGDASAGPDPTVLKRLMSERDEARFQNSGLKLELEKLREEVDATTRERDNARRANELLQVEKVAMEEVVPGDEKGSTQRIVFPHPHPAGNRE